jgi:hypothetical protein
MPTDRRGSWLQTFSGKALYPLDPKVEEIDIVDVAHALSCESRFTGHTRIPYSVAEHCCRCADLITSLAHGLDLDLSVNELQRYALMHDAHEAYARDLPRPFKALPEFEFYNLACVRLQRVIWVKFNLPVRTAEHPLVVEADNILLATEKKYLMGPEPQPWAPLPEPLTLSCGDEMGWVPQIAEGNFLEQFTDLFNSASNSK